MRQSNSPISFRTRRWCKIACVTTFWILYTKYGLLDQHRDAVSSRQTQNDDSRRLSGFKFPADAFTPEERLGPPLILYVLGVIYMFTSLAIVCDESFVPCLEEISDHWELTPDVAGATFMAAGGSAPEFFTCLVDSLTSESDIGAGTIVGSASFNILFCIGACAFVAPEPLKLSSWPLSRDCFFYAIDLVLLYLTFKDGKVQLYECAILHSWYWIYCIVMKYNERLESCFNSLVSATRQGKSEGTSMTFAGPPTLVGSPCTAKSVGPSNSITQDISTEEPITEIPNRCDASPSSSSSYEHIPSPAESVDRAKCKDPNLQLPICTDRGRRSSNSSITIDDTWNLKSDSTFFLKSCSQTTLRAAVIKSLLSRSRCSNSSINCKSPKVVPDRYPEFGETPSFADELQEIDELSLDLKFPTKQTLMSWISYIYFFPILFLIIYTVPKLHPGDNGALRLFASFAVSIFWMAVFSYCMVWWAITVAITIGIKEHILGLTLLAVGTSIPDLITTIIVARDGKGDMAVSSSLGSNIFDVSVGLPIPWALYCAINKKMFYQVKATQLDVSVGVLLGVLLSTVLVIVAFKWTLTKNMGRTLLLLYVAFTVALVMFED